MLTINSMVVTGVKKRLFMLMNALENAVKVSNYEPISVCFLTIKYGKIR